MLEVLHFFDDREWDIERDGLEVERTSTLSCFARTCKAFFGLAIPILWRRLRSLLPLLGLSSCYGEAQIRLKMARLTIHSYAWCRLCGYAGYVEELDAIHAEYPLDPSIWHALRHLTRGRPLLPNLRDLQWRITSAQCTALAYLISPSLRQLDLHFSPPQGPLSPIERLEWAFALWMPLSLTLPIPRLTHVSLSYSGFHSPTLLFPISKLGSLQSFRLHVDCDAPGAPLPASALSLFLNTESLEHLDLNCELAVFSEGYCKRDVKAFTNLRSLCILHGPGSDSLYPSFAFPTLTRLTIHRYRDVTLMDFHATCAIWAQHFPTLQSFSCELASTITVPLRLADAISPLLRLRNIREFKLTFALNSQITVLDQDLIDAAQSWPHLTSFALVASSSTATAEPSWDVEGPGFRSLEAFTQRCPALIRLWLPHLVLRSRNVPAGKPVAREGQGGHGMREFVVRWIDADDYRLAAALVDRLFPHLETRDALWGESLGQDDDSEGDEQEDAWEEMYIIFPEP
ncbi:hypothetical protein V8D89_004750 [Ganoderma adspersum]